MTHYDVCIIGAGMIGSAAAKYCRLIKNDNAVLFIGPEEPKKEDYCRTEIFGAHYDEARITSNLDTDPIWSYLAAESIKRYRSLETESNIDFFTENGYLDLFKSKENLNKIRQVAQSQNVSFTELIGVEAIRSRFPYMNPIPGTIGLYEPSKAGTINPRKLTAAQQCLAAKGGATLLRDFVIKIERTRSGDFKLHTKSNGDVISGKVVLCAGSFLFHNQLLPKHLMIDVKPSLVRAARIPIEECLLKQLNMFPSVSMMTATENDSKTFNDKFYVMAPVKYPDGRFYIKIGLHGDLKNGSSCREVSDWHKKGLSEVNSQSDYKANLIAVTNSFLPDLKFNIDEIVYDTCSIMKTPNRRPYIDRIENNLYIATGCNGFAAKSSDEIGRILATLALTDSWDCPFPAEQFKCKFIHSI